MLFFEDLRNINSSKLSRLNYGPHVASALPPYRILWQFKEGRRPALIKESHGAGWLIVGYTKNPPFQHEHRPGPPDIAILFEYLDGETAWWHFADPLEYEKYEQELDKEVKEAGSMLPPMVRPKVAEGEEKEPLEEPKEPIVHFDNPEPKSIPFEDRIQGLPDEEVMLTVPMKLVMSPKHTEGVLTFFVGGVDVFDDDGDTKIGSIQGGINGSPYLSQKGTGETWKIPVSAIWDAFVKAMEERAERNQDPAKG